MITVDDYDIYGCCYNSSNISDELNSTLKNEDIEFLDTCDLDQVFLSQCHGIIVKDNPLPGYVRTEDCQVLRKIDGVWNVVSTLLSQNIPRHSEEQRSSPFNPSDFY